MSTKKRSRKLKVGTLIAAIAAVAALITALTGAFSAVIDVFQGGDDASARSARPQSGDSISADHNACVVNGSHISNVKCPEVAPSTAVAKPSPEIGSLSSASGCGGEPVVQHPLPKAEICVIYWCKGDVVGRRSRRMLQIKLRPKVTNNSDEALDVRVTQPSALLLLVGGAHADRRWLPPPKTAASALQPRRVNVNGASFWGLPPNVVGDFSPTNSGVYTGFGSTWHQTTIAPGSSYFAVGRNADGSLIHHGNLVFEVPMDSRGVIHPVGLALIKRHSGTVLAFQAYGDWGKPSSPGSF